MSPFDRSNIQFLSLSWKMVSTLVIWLFWKFIEGIRLNFVLVFTKSIWTLVNVIAMHFYEVLCSRLVAVKGLTDFSMKFKKSATYITHI